jgi:hypothetical protein
MRRSATSIGKVAALIARMDEEVEAGQASFQTLISLLMTSCRVDGATSSLRGSCRRRLPKRFGPLPCPCRRAFAVAVAANSSTAQARP